VKPVSESRNEYRRSEKADGIYAGKRRPKLRQRSEAMIGRRAKLFQESRANDRLELKGISRQQYKTAKYFKTAELSS